MNKLLILAFFLFFSMSGCNKNNSTIKISEITEIYLNHRSSLIFGKSLIKIKKYSKNRYSHIEMIHVMDSLGKVSIEEKTCNITKVQFDSIRYFIKRIDEANIIEHKEAVFLDGEFHKLMFGDGINFKHYEIQNPYSSKRKNIEKEFVLDPNYIKALDKIYAICNKKN